MMDRAQQDKQQGADMQQNKAEQTAKPDSRRPARLRRHPRMVYGNPDEFFIDLLEEQLENS